MIILIANCEMNFKLIHDYTMFPSMNDNIYQRKSMTERERQRKIFPPLIDFPKSASSGYRESQIRDNGTSSRSVRWKEGLGRLGQNLFAFLTAIAGS